MDRRLILGGLLALAVVLLGFMGLRSAAPALAQGAGEYDMVAMLKALTQANGQIRDANSVIVARLAEVQVAGDQVKAVREQLARSEGAVEQQLAYLERLKAITAAQAELSLQLKNLTEQIGPSTRGIALTADAEAKTVAAMAATSDRLAAAMGDIRSINRSTNEKLRRAEQLSALVLKRMP